MADAFTTFLNLTNPEVGASSDTWGTKENADRVTVDAMLSTLITGLTLSAAGSTATFGIAVGAAIGAALTSAYTKTTSAWALGTAAGSLDTGAIANTTWYHVYIIQRSDTGVVDILISLSATAPTMPTNYDRKRRIGSMLTNGSAQWVKFTQTGDLFLWDVPAASADINYAPTGTAAAKVVNVPTGVKVIAKLLGLCQIGAGDATAFLIFSPSQSVTSISTTDANVIAYLNSAAQSDQGFAVDILTDTSAQVKVIGSGTTASSLIRATAIGWIDTRGKA